MMQQIVPRLLAESPDAVPSLLVVVANDILLATAIICPLPLASEVLAGEGRACALLLICVFSRGWPIVHLLALLEWIAGSSLKIGLQKNSIDPLIIEENMPAQRTCTSLTTDMVINAIYKASQIEIRDSSLSFKLPES